MSGKIITPTNRSVVPPEKEEAQFKEPLQRTRAMLFIGAIMGMAEESNKYGTHNVIGGKEWLRPDDVHSAAEMLLRLLSWSYENEWNVARKALELHLARMEEAFKNEDKEKAPKGA